MFLHLHIYFHSWCSISCESFPKIITVLDWNICTTTILPEKNSQYRWLHSLAVVGIKHIWDVFYSFFERIIQFSGCELCVDLWQYYSLNYNDDIHCPCYQALTSNLRRFTGFDLSICLIKAKIWDLLYIQKTSFVHYLNYIFTCKNVSQGCNERCQWKSEIVEYTLPIWLAAVSVPQS